MGSVWRDARTIGDLGRNMADWLEGRIPSWPGYGADFGYEESVSVQHLVPVLAAVNRAGFVTTCSQPAMTGTTRQRAWVEGIIDRRNPLLDRLLGLQGQGLAVHRGWPKQIVDLTEEGGRPFTSIGGFKLRRNDVTREWTGTGRHALRDLRENGVRIHLIDMTWGRDDRLWPALANTVR